MSKESNTLENIHDDLGLIQAELIDIRTELKNLNETLIKALL